MSKTIDITAFEWFFKEWTKRTKKADKRKGDFMQLVEVVELLKDGQVVFKEGDLKTYIDKAGKKLAHDTRSRIREDGLHIVKPIGIDVMGYVYYVCYDCGLVHSVHKSSVGKGKLIMPGCCQANSNSHRILIDDNRQLKKVKRDKFFLDVKF